LYNKNPTGGVGAYLERECGIAWAQTMSIANTKKVVTKGMINVSQGQWAATATTNATTEIRNSIQYNPFDLFCISMKKKFAQK